MKINNRLDLFKRLTIDQLQETLHTEIIDKLLDSQYEKFIELWKYVKEKRNDIIDVSIFLNDNSTLHFEIRYIDNTLEIK